MKNIIYMILLICVFSMMVSCINETDNNDKSQELIGIAKDSNEARNWCSIEGNCGQFTDTRDSKEYQWTKIGSQIWMAENLNFTPEDGTYRCYNLDSNNCKTYGKLYNWKTSQYVCPSGWVLPDSAKWMTLYNSIGGWKTNLKAKSSLWNIDDGVNNYGFNSLPGGDCIRRECANLGFEAFWWTATPSNNGTEYGRGVTNVGGYSRATGTPTTDDAEFSVRCIKNN